MFFNDILGIKDVNKENTKIFCREAIRAIIINNNKILMVKSNTGDYKFPGGGVKKEENHIETLKREVIEETGYILNNVNDKLGVIIERNIDEFEDNAIFQMTSHYYLCDLSDKKTVQSLDEYEAELEFLPIWVSVDDAINNNKIIIKEEKDNMNRWVYRETLVLRYIKNYLELKKI